MGSRRKKISTNGFYFFLKDYVKTQQEIGRNISLKIAAEECNPFWENLPEEEKENYKKLAQKSKRLSDDTKHSKLTNVGLTYSELEAIQHEEQLKREKADEEIRMTVSNFDSDSLRTHLFYIIHCNYYCKTDEGIYVPGEIAIVEFNLEDGIRRTYHTLINPGPIPCGYAYEAKKNIEEVHDLPFPPYEEGDSDYFGILTKVLNFIKPGMLPNGKYPPLYCIENNIKASENILQALSDNKCEGKNYFRVFHLHKMFFWLKNKCVEFIEEENVGFPLLSNAESEITKDCFLYAPGISCAYHTMSEEKFFNCSLSVVQRYVFLLCDHCCQYINIELIPEKHCQKNCDLNRSKSKKASQKSSYIPPRQVNEFESDDLSSYCGEMSSVDWRRETAGSSLQEGLESSMSALKLSSVRSRPQSVFSEEGAKGSSSTRPKQKPFGDEEYRKRPMGRGISRR